jgi:hypothetical protein
MNKQPKDLHQTPALPATMALEDALILLNQPPNLRMRRLEKNLKCFFDTKELAQEASGFERLPDFPIIEWQFTDEKVPSKNEFSGMDTLLCNKSYWMQTDFGEHTNRLVRCRPFLSHLSLQATFRGSPCRQQRKHDKMLPADCGDVEQT